jgi:hypothetical protein
MVTATFMVLNALCLTGIYSASEHNYIPGKLVPAVQFVSYTGKVPVRILIVIDCRKCNFVFSTSPSRRMLGNTLK